MQGPEDAIRSKEGPLVDGGALALLTFILWHWEQLAAVTWSLSVLPTSSSLCQSTRPMKVATTLVTDSDPVCSNLKALCPVGL